MRQPKHKQRSQAFSMVRWLRLADLASQPENSKSPLSPGHAAAGAVPAVLMCPVVHVTAPSAGTVVPFGFAALYIGEGSPLPARHSLLAQHVSRSSVESHAEPTHSSLTRELSRW